MNQQKTKFQIKIYDEELQSGELQGVPDWLQEFEHGLVDESVPGHRDASRSSHALFLEPRTKVVPSEHNIFAHLPSPEIISDTLWWYRTWLLSGYNFTHVKRKLHRKLKEACRSSFSRTGSQKSFTLTIPWNLAKLVKIIVRRHHKDRNVARSNRQMAPLETRTASLTS